MPFIEYQRPLAPGSVRITRHAGAVTVAIAPDSAWRTFFTETTSQMRRLAAHDGVEI